MNLVQTVAETLLFYHPGVWWISRQIRLERENCCDDAALVDAEPGEQDAVAALKKRGARVERDATGMVETASFSNTKATDADLVHLKGMTNLRRLDLHSASRSYAGFNRADVTDAGLAHLGGLTKLEQLNLGNSNYSKTNCPQFLGSILSSKTSSAMSPVFCVFQ